MSRRLSRLDVSAGLSHQQRRQLSGLVLDLSALYEVWHREKRQVAWGRVLAKRSPGQVRKLERKIAKVRDQLDETLEYVRSVGVGSGPDQTGNVYLARILDGISSSSAVPQLRKAQEAIDEIRLPSPEDLQRDPPPAALRRIAQQSTEVLFDFFVTECGLLKNEAEVRIAKIGAEFWNWQVSYNEEYEGDFENWKGSDAIRKRMKRGRRSPTDT